MIRKFRLLALSLAAAIASPTLGAQDSIGYNVSLVNTMGSGDFAPYYLTANRHGLLTQSANVILDIKAVKDVDLGRRFSWGAGAELAAGWNESTAYMRYSPENGWSEHDLHGRRVMLQQLYAQIKFRGVYLTGGIRQYDSPMLNRRLSSGDLTLSGNSASMPSVTAGFIDFQEIPFTNGWVGIEGVVSYGWFTDNDWMRDHYNYYTNHITTGSVMCYRRCYFQTKPSQPFSVIVGAQSSTIFGGTMDQYINGNYYTTKHYLKGIRQYIEAFFPAAGNSEDFALGNTLGSWDLMARYTLRGGDQIKAYFQWPWEDGSGVGRRNGFDGLWGIEYKASRKGWINGAVIEYIDFTNQSGPIHWSPGDRPGTDLTGQATGGDDYYNNAYYNAYANYGMSIGTPFLKAPVFNTDGFPGFTASRQRGFHAAVEGSPTERLSYRAMISYRKAMGGGILPIPEDMHSTSFMVEAAYSIARLPGLAVKAAFALDHGNLFGNNSGAELTISYRGDFSLLKSNKKPDAK